jgi:spermidine synthase
MKNEKVIVTDEHIVLERNTRSVVMAKGAKTLTELHSHIVCQNKGDILDIGFGMGFSANKIYELADSYTCIEINPQIYQNAIKWAEDKPNVEIIFGDWIDIIPTLSKKFDGVFFDTHNDPNSHLAEEYVRLVSKEGTIFSHWNYFQIKSVDQLNTYKCLVDSNSMPKLTNSIHNIHWTYFLGGEFKKGSNKIKFHGPDKII